MVMPIGFGMGMGMSSGNVYDYMKSRYGCGHPDFAERPKIAGYPMDTVPQAPLRPAEKSWFGRMIANLTN